MKSNLLWLSSIISILVLNRFIFNLNQSVKKSDKSVFLEPGRPLLHSTLIKMACSRYEIKFEIFFIATKFRKSDAAQKTSYATFLQAQYLSEPRWSWRSEFHFFILLTWYL